MDPQTQQFLLDEFNTLRREIEAQMGALRDLIQYALLVSAAIWTWLFTRTKRGLPSIAAFIPPLLSVLLCARALTLSLQIGKIGNYIFEVEQKLGLPAGLGWEHYRQTLGWSVQVDIAADALWAAIILMNFIAAFSYLGKAKKRYSGR
jgi:hypothetical protein